MKMGRKSYPEKN